MSARTRRAPFFLNTMKPEPLIFAPRATDYSEFTIGATYKPVIAGTQLFMLRPEFRFDDALNGVKAYNGSTNQFTFGLDLVVKI